MTDTPEVRAGMPDVQLSREEFERRYRLRFVDPAFEPLQEEITRIIAAAWQGYNEYRKAPRTRKAGTGFADPGHDLSVDWLAARDAVAAAQARHDDAAARMRVLLINGATRSDQTCPGEISKTWRLCQDAKAALEESGAEVELLDLSRLASEFGRVIYPCKTCVSTAMPLCHWPCSCYPNHALGQVNDWMNDIYPMWVAAHGVMIIAPVNWYQAPTGLKAMIDRLVCADGGNPDPTSTHGKKPDEAKALELAGWHYPRHLAGRLYAVAAHGDAAGAESLRRNLSDWLSDMGLIAAGKASQLDRYVGYYEPYATSHQALDRDDAFREEVRNAARALAEALRLRRAGKYGAPGESLADPRPK